MEIDNSKSNTSNNSKQQQRQGMNQNYFVTFKNPPEQV